MSENENINPAIAAFAEGFKLFQSQNQSTIARLSARIGRETDEGNALLDDYAADMKSFLGAKAANEAGDDQDAKEEAIAQAEGWVTNHVSNASLEGRIAAVLWLAGCEEGEAALREITHPSANAAPQTGEIGTLPRDSWRRNLAAGDGVWWDDPDCGISSGCYKVLSVPDGDVKENSVLFLTNEEGSEAEVLASELSPARPEGLYPVVDGDGGNVGVYGHATSRDDAIHVGNATFADEVVDAYLAEDVAMPDGTTLPKAWVAMTFRLPETRTVRLILDVTYDLNGEVVETMVENLLAMCQRAIGEGMLTGETNAEVEEYSMDAVTQPDPMSEDELADFMLQRIENGALALEDIPVRLARYGLMDPDAFVAEMRERMGLTAQ